MRRVYAWVLVAAAAAGAVVARRATGARKPPSSEGPVLVVRSARADEPAPAGRDDRAMALAAATMTPPARAHAVEQVDIAATRLEARLSPLGTDFEDSDPIDDLQRGLEPYRPVFTAAREFERGAWVSRDLAVRVASSCREASLVEGETCLSLWNAAEGPSDLGRRARLLAWAAARAVVFDVGTSERARGSARALRESAASRSSTIALVLTDDDLALRPAPDRQALEASSRRLAAVMRAAGRADAAEVEAPADAARDARVAPWLAVAASEIVVVPRLSSMADHAGLAKEIEAAVNGPIRWGHRPDAVQSAR